MLSMEYKQSQGNHTLFVHHSATGGMTALLVYVDDIIVIDNDMEDMEFLRGCLVKEFEIKELILSKESLYLNKNTYLIC